MDVLYVYLYVVYMSYEIIVHLITSSNMDSSERNVRKFIKYALKLICNYSDSSYTILTVSGIVSTCCSPTKADKERGKHTDKNSEKMVCHRCGPTVSTDWLWIMLPKSFVAMLCEILG